ncbi:MAG: 3-isopropylmalate dehydrogenase [Proteobacteria bacterium]|nr:3-isopropylmalate dehydrogenase [Pseudomonadota bacterium]MBU1709605.1 3-isopropylmalate dehydrogenase [Pseudomonadota bacterium]
MSHKVLVLPGDGIGGEVVAEALKVLKVLEEDQGLKIVLEEALVGGCAYDDCGKPLPEETLRLAREADAVLLGAVGGPKWEPLHISVRPEKALLGLRSELELFANLRPVKCYPALEAKSPLNTELVSGLDMMIVRELTGGIYFGQPRGVRILENGERQGYNTLVYSESEIRRIGRTAFEIAMKRDKRVVSVDKANVLECTELWREVMAEVAQDYPEVVLKNMYVDNAAMQIVCAPKQFDVMVTTNLFGDILSDCASVASGSIGMLPSASLDANNKGMYEPIHGSAPDIAGKQIANPLATILSAAMMLRYSFNQEFMAGLIEQAVTRTLTEGYRTGDIYSAGCKKVSTGEMGDAVVVALRNQSTEYLQAGNS